MGWTLNDWIALCKHCPPDASHHARLLAHTRRGGVPRQAHDLIIAAHAAQTGRTVVSRDATARFGNLPGVDAQVPDL